MRLHPPWTILHVTANFEGICENIATAKAISNGYSDLGIYPSIGQLLFKCLTVRFTIFRIPCCPALARTHSFKSIFPKLIQYEVIPFLFGLSDFGYNFALNGLDWLFTLVNKIGLHHIGVVGKTLYYSLFATAIPRYCFPGIVYTESI